MSRSLFRPTTLKRAVERLGFVQADPIRAPARAQDLTLRHRVTGYRAGDLERRYAHLGIEEDFFVNYGFLPAAVQALMHPRGGFGRSSAVRRQRMQALLEFARQRGVVHPRQVDEHFSHGTVTNYWGGSSSATTHLLDGMHYRGLLRVARRERGIRLYAAQQHAPGPAGAAGRRARIDALVDVVVGVYAPLPGASLANLVGRLRYAVPQWRGELKSALERATRRLAHARVAGVDWYWPAGEPLPPAGVVIRRGAVRLLAPFDPVVWDRRRFELFWGWAYRFEAYTPLPKRRLGYYALPLLWGDRVIGWGNVSMKNGELHSALGYVSGEAPRDAAFAAALDAELARMREFLTPKRGVMTDARSRPVETSVLLVRARWTFSPGDLRSHEDCGESPDTIARSLHSRGASQKSPAATVFRWTYNNVLYLRTKGTNTMAVTSESVLSDACWKGAASGRRRTTATIDFFRRTSTSCAPPAT